MNVELACYLLFAFVSIYYAVLGKKRLLSKRDEIFLYVLLAFLIFIVRSNYDVDIQNYATSMQKIRQSFYYLREPIIWQGQAYLYAIFRSTFLVFLVFDAIASFLTVVALKKFRLPRYAYYLVFIFFPFVLGMQNIYRQWFASVLLLWAFSIVCTQPRFFRLGGALRLLAIWLLAFLSHNMSAAFLPIIFIRCRSLFEKSIFIVSCFISAAAIYYGGATKSSAATGSALEWIYFLLLCILTTAVIVAKKLQIERESKVLIGSFLVVSAIGLVSSFNLASAGAERIWLSGLILLFPVIVLFIESIRDIRDRLAVRTLFVLSGFSIIFLFPTRGFLLGF